MSDLQLVTGFSILISGYSQLRCSLSCYHWRIVSYLAWFSSLTHLSCLTFLRNYLYNRPEERTWRLIAIGSNLIMLLVAISSLCKVQKYAICYIGKSAYMDGEVILSELLLIFGFISRVIRLHKALSVGFGGRIRPWCSQKVRDWLFRLYIRCGVSKTPESLKQRLLYRPCLALYLSGKVIIDSWTSMFGEV